MKKITLSLALFSLMLFSCSNSDDEANITDNQIIGKWFYVSEFYGEEERTSPENCFNQQYYEFFSNGIISMKMYREPCQESDDYNGNYVIVGNTLELTDLQGSDDLNYSFDIVSLSETILIIEEEFIDDNENFIYRLELRKE
jgi:hypothetical protein